MLTLNRVTIIRARPNLKARYQLSWLSADDSVLMVNWFSVGVAMYTFVLWKTTQFCHTELKQNSKFPNYRELVGGDFTFSKIQSKTKKKMYFREEKNIPKFCWPNHPLPQPFVWLPLVVLTPPETGAPPEHKLCCCLANNRTVQQYVISITSNGI